MTTYATFDPAAKDTGIVLSNGNLTVTANASGGSVVAATIGVASGKWYWEINVDTYDAFIAIGTGVTPLPPLNWGNWMGYNASSVGFFCDGNITPYPTAYTTACTTGDVIGCALDVDGGTLEFYRNGVSLGVAFTGLTGAQYPGASVYNLTGQITANFGATSFAYTPPAGFNAGVYIGGISATIAAIDGSDIASVITSVITGAEISATDAGDIAAIISANWTTAQISAIDGYDIAQILINVTTGAIISIIDGADIAGITANAAVEVTNASIASIDSPDISSLISTITTGGNISATDASDILNFIAANWTTGNISATDGWDIISILTEVTTGAIISAIDGKDTAFIQGPIVIISFAGVALIYDMQANEAVLIDQQTFIATVSDYWAQP